MSGSPHPKKSRQSNSYLKACFLYWWYCAIRDHSKRNYCKLQKLQGHTPTSTKRYTYKHIGKLANGSLLHHDNAPCQSSRLSKKVSVCPHPPYCSNLAPCDFCFFPKLKTVLIGKRFDTIPDTETTRVKQLKGLPKEAFQNFF